MHHFTHPHRIRTTSERPGEPSNFCSSEPVLISPLLQLDTGWHFHFSFILQARELKSKTQEQRPSAILFLVCSCISAFENAVSPPSSVQVVQRELQPPETGAPGLNTCHAFCAKISSLYKCVLLTYRISKFQK